MVSQVLRMLRDQLEPQIAAYFARHAITARFYYAFFNSRFTREQLTVLKGRSLYSSGVRITSNPALRRNIHRLEKGLLMRPRASTFAADYIEQTVSTFENALQVPSSDPVELAWARDVLEEYFSVVGSGAVIDKSRLKFGSLVAPRETPPEKVPRPRRESVFADVPYDAFLALCHQRRSVRWFDGRPVPRKLIEDAVAAAAQAPSACNRQPYCFRIVENSREAARLARISMGTSGYAEQIPSLIIVLGDFSSFSHERDRHLPYIDGALAAMQLMLALETLGLASCPINWPDVEPLERRMENALGLPRHIRPIMLIAVGYADPDGGVAHSAKKSVTQLTRYTNDYTF